jgi:hypothetical protein
MNTKMLALLAKALIHKPYIGPQKDLAGANMVMPQISCDRRIYLNAKHCNGYNALTKWQPALAAVVHPNYIQTLSLPLQLEMMVNKLFPFSPMGIVHLANQIIVKRLPSQSEAMDLTTYFGDIYFHKKGWLFEVITIANSTCGKSSGGEQVKASSFYLAREKHSDIDIKSKLQCKQAPNWIIDACANNDIVSNVGYADGVYESKSTNESLNFTNNIGRKYANISGDYNPIHLHAISAKLFGFKKAIVHGMFSKALVVSGVAQKHPFYKGAFEIDTVFKQAISLPAQTSLSSHLSGPNALHYSLHSKHTRKERCYLQGIVRY